MHIVGVHSLSHAPLVAIVNDFVVGSESEMSTYAHGFLISAESNLYKLS
jgi:hypothetical protein